MKMAAMIDPEEIDGPARARPETIRIGAVIDPEEIDAPAGARPEPFRIGLLGCGVVGSQVAKALFEDAPILERAVGAPLELCRVAVRDPGKTRPVDLAPGIITTDALGVAIDPGIDIVIEVIGGTKPALDAILAALGDNKSVVTANKELLAGAGADLLDAPDADLHFEAAVCGAIPLIRTLRDSCAGDRIEGFAGIFSGTCNFVLSRMTESGCTLDHAIDEARRLGYAEADPTADIDGRDAAAKVAVAARIAFGVPATIADVRCEGISSIDRSLVVEAPSQGLVCKLVGRAQRSSRGIDLRVAPQLLPAGHPLARVDGAHNAVIVDAARAGRLTFQGAGAGGDPSAAAILGDVVAAARRRVRSRKTALACV